jgi:hypothetical protein
MLADRPEEQEVLFKEIITKKLTVREAEAVARRVATDRVRKREKYLDPVVIELERNLTESLGTRVRIDKNKEGGTVSIDFFGPDDLRSLLERLQKQVAAQGSGSAGLSAAPAAVSSASAENQAPVDDRAPVEVAKEENEEVYSLKNFSL